MFEYLAEVSLTLDSKSFLWCLHVTLSFCEAAFRQVAIQVGSLRSHETVFCISYKNMGTHEVYTLFVLMQLLMKLFVDLLFLNKVTYMSLV